MAAAYLTSSHNTRAATILAAAYSRTAPLGDSLRPHLQAHLKLYAKKIYF